MSKTDLIDECASTRYCVGDAVYAINDLTYIGNPYHFKTALNAFYKVRVADRNRFSTGDRNLIDVCGMDWWEVNLQENGNPLYSDRVLLHVEKDKEKIIQRIDEVVNSFLADAEQRKQKKIAANRAMIQALQDEIAEIEEKGVTFGFNNKRMVDFILANKAALLEKLK